MAGFSKKTLECHLEWCSYSTLRPKPVTRLDRVLFWIVNLFDV